MALGRQARRSADEPGGEARARQGRGRQHRGRRRALREGQDASSIPEDRAEDRRRRRLRAEPRRGDEQGPRFDQRDEESVIWKYLARARDQGRRVPAFDQAGAVQEGQPCERSLCARRQSCRGRLGLRQADVEVLLLQEDVD